MLVLGASKEAAGPGPLVSSLAAGATAGKFPIPITIVPGRAGPRATSRRWPEPWRAARPILGIFDLRSPIY